MLLLLFCVAANAAAIVTTDNTAAYDIFALSRGYDSMFATFPTQTPAGFYRTSKATTTTTMKAKVNGSEFEVINEWKYLDFEYKTYAQRQHAITNGVFIAENNVPLGIDRYRDRLFITTPRWKDGVPASLNWLPYPSDELSPALRPYPHWEAHSSVDTPDCSRLMSVYRTAIDSCGRLWLIDAGIVNAIVSLNQICPPKIVAYDLASDQQVVRYQLPPEQVKQDSLHSNIAVDIRDGQCNDVHVYVSDVWRFGLVVFSLAKQRSWRVTNYNFSPNPIASDFNVYGLNFQWLDGIFGMSLSLEQSQRERVLYFHPMASFKEFMISTELLRDESLWPARAQDVAQYFVELGDRGAMGQSSTSGIARSGVMFFTQVHRDTVGCWHTQKPYARDNLGTLGNATIIQFPNDLIVDQEREQSVWVMSNRLPIYLYSQLNYDEINFRILRTDVQAAIANTVCAPEHAASKRTPVTVQLHEGQCY